MPDEPVLPDEDLVTPEYRLHSRTQADRLLGLSDAELIQEASQYAISLATADEDKLFGVVMLLMAAAAAVMSVLVARRGLKIIRGDVYPLRDAGYG
jgi:hypothetical protein